MLAKKRIGVNIIYKILLTLISGILLLSDKIELNILSLTILIFGSMIIVKFDLLHPYVWFGGVFYLYSISYPVLYYINSIYATIGFSKEIIIMQWLAYLTVLFFVTSNRVISYQFKNNYVNGVVNNYLIIFTASILVASSFYMSLKGYASKSEIDNNSIIELGLRTGLVLLLLYGIELARNIDYNLKKILLLIFFVFIPIFFFFYYSGERDYLYRFFILTFFIFYALKGHMFKKRIMFSLPILLVSIPIVNMFKYLGLSGEVKGTDKNFIEMFLMSDFHAASRNLQTLLNQSSNWNYFKGYTIIMDFLKGIEPPFLNFVNFSVGGWFNNAFFDEDRAGQGFTLVGEGYVNFGYLGIIGVFIFISLLINIFYKRSNNSIYWFIIYIFLIPTFMYAIRGSLANILSPLINYILMTVVIVIIVNYISKQVLKKKQKVTIYKERNIFYDH